jgi:hypothetical protein
MTIAAPPHTKIRTDLLMSAPWLGSVAAHVAPRQSGPLLVSLRALPATDELDTEDGAVNPSDQ